MYCTTVEVEYCIWLVLALQYISSSYWIGLATGIAGLLFSCNCFEDAICTAHCGGLISAALFTIFFLISCGTYRSTRLGTNKTCVRYVLVMVFFWLFYQVIGTTCSSVHPYFWQSRSWVCTPEFSKSDVNNVLYTVISPLISQIVPFNCFLKQTTSNTVHNEVLYFTLNKLKTPNSLFCVSKIWLQTLACTYLKTFFL